ncbi:MAG: helix-turn-helix transcriptional regulator [Clostridia bacterium]|nr:helix-turn-helix transcriptional regulator [Clostridia bacterium]
MTFGQRLKKHRKQKDFTQMELAEAIGVSMQAVSKWENDIGMPDISQIVPLCKELDISSDVLLGIVNDENGAKFEELYAKCMEAENVPACDWPVPVEKIEPFIRQMYDYFSVHPNHPRAADYLLDQTEKANEILAKIPCQYSDRAYHAAEVMKKAGNYEKTEILCRESFTQGARFISRNIRLIASLPTKTLEDRIAYDEYMLRIVNAFLSGGDYMPHRQIYQKMSLLSSLIKWYLKIDNITYAERYFCELLDIGEQYLCFLANGSKEKHCFYWKMILIYKKLIGVSNKNANLFWNVLIVRFVIVCI